MMSPGSMRGLRWLPDKPRDKKLVPPRARGEAFRCCSGRAPWPLVFLGDAGSGKTCTALLMLDKWGGYYTTCPDWVERRRKAKLGELRTASYPPYPVSLEEVHKEWSGVNLAVMDELGAIGKVSDHRYESVKLAMDAREGRPTVYASNLSLEQLEGVYDDRVASRLSAGTIVTLSGDRRGQEPN